jgi:hypothetical protein
VTTRWYCQTCEKAIEEAAIDEHEADGHSVRGVVRPDRLLSNDPWQLGTSDGQTHEQTAEGEESSE